MKFLSSLRNVFLATLLVGVFGLTGCQSTKDLERVNQEQAMTIQALNEEIARLNGELDNLSASRSELAQAMTELENKFQTEMSDGNVSLSMQSRGLVVTVLDRVLFDSGKAELKSTSLQTLDKVAEILGTKVEDNRIYIEGHTDNVPIKYSGWKSNWELSAERAIGVIDYFVAEKGLDPNRIAAVGYGEYKPVADNDSAEGRGKNRRVEIVISPQKMA